jgi:hypothetical protein
VSWPVTSPEVAGGPLFLASRRPVPARRPAPRDICPHTGRHGWSLDVEADGRPATVRAPGPAIAITSIGTGTARIALI